MNGKLLQPKFIKPFSKGQITLPKDYRQYLGIDENIWLKISLIDDNKIILQPVKEEKINPQKAQATKPKIAFNDYLKIIPKLKGAFGPELEKENKQIRKEIEKRLRKYQF